MGPIQVAVRVHLIPGCDVRNWGCDRCGREDKTGGRWDDDTKRRKRNCDGFTNPALIVPKIGRIERCPWAEPEPMIALRWWQDWKFMDLRRQTLMDEPQYMVEAIRCAEQAYQQTVAEQQKPPPPPKKPETK